MTYLDEVLQDAPDLYLRLGETEGTKAADASPNGRHATYVGSPVLGVAGALRGDADAACGFDGEDDRIDLPALPAAGTTLSIELWLRPEAGGDATQCLVGEADGSPSLLLKSSGKLSVFYGGADHENATPLTAGAWHHVAVVIDGGAGSFYVDGGADGGFAGFPSGFAPGRVGNDNAGNAFKGALDEVALYVGQALSAGRVRAHYAAAFRGWLNLLPRLRRLLKDEDAATYRWSDAELADALQRALVDLSRAQPRQLTTTLTAAPGSRQLDLSGLAGLIRVEAVEWPAGSFPPCYVPFSVWGSTLSLLSESAPSGPDDVAVHWLGLHSLDRFESTLPQAAEDALLTGAAGFAAEAWASHAANRANTAGAEAVDQYLRLGERWLKDFRERLRRLGGGQLQTSRLYAPARSLPRDRAAFD